MSEDKFVAVLKQDLMIFMVGVLLFACGLFVPAFGMVGLIVLLLGCFLMGFAGVDILRVSTKFTGGD